MSSFKRRIARAAAAEAPKPQPGAHAETGQQVAAQPAHQKVQRSEGKTLDRGRVLRRKSAGR